MSDPREDTVQALEEVAEALKVAQRALRVAEVAARKALRSESRGVTDAAVLRTTRVAEYRPNLDEALANLERARHRVLVANFRVALGDGMTIGELARNYGFSRQRAARYAKEARGDHRSAPGPEALQTEAPHPLSGEETTTATRRAQMASGVDSGPCSH